MATVMNPRSHGLAAPRTVTQKVCIGLGIFFILAGLGGIVMPGLLGMHLSLVHNIIHLASGALALWVGYSDNSKNAYNFSIAFGVVYGLLGVVGFIFGQPGYPSVGHMEADQNLMRIIPNAFELGTADHIVHIILGVSFLGAAYAARKRNEVNIRGRRTSGVSGRTYSNRTSSSDVFRTGSDVPNSQSNLKDASLGRSDINRRSDVGRRSDFERRV